MTGFLIGECVCEGEWVLGMGIAPPPLCEGVGVGTLCVGSGCFALGWVYGMVGVTASDGMR